VTPARMLLAVGAGLAGAGIAMAFTAVQLMRQKG
jgi:hypothetical protein